MGLHRLPADLDDQRPAVRQAVRPVRSAPDLPVRDRRLHGRVGLLRSGPGDVAARRRSRDPGSRGRRAVPDRACGDRRPLLAVGTRSLPGAVRRGVRVVGPDRAGDRWAAHRHHRLAMGVLLQPADRRDRLRDRVAEPAVVPPRVGATVDRLRGCGPVHRGPRPDPGRADQQAERANGPIRRSAG